jgi:phosphoribosylanthranilate isomerase
VKIKLCGLTRKQDVELAAELGAWALGFIFYEKSPRAITPAQARILVQNVHSNIRTVGVFVNETLDSVQSTVETSGINAIQLHGEESVEFCEELKKRIPQLDLIKAFRPRTSEDLKEIRNYAPLTQSILIDSFSASARGGTGLTSDWNLALQAKSYGPVILAGGLHPENIQAAMSAVHPEALDVSSGLETSPGIKSEQKMRQFFQTAQPRKS